ncbi:MAG: yutH [Bacillales bacterium]|nr:yutH [Bacillales bacterium]
MREEIIYYYHVDPKDTVKLGNYNAFKLRNYFYFIIQTSYKEDDIKTLKGMTDFMSSLGDHTVAIPQYNREGNLLSKVDNKNIVLLRTVRKQISDTRSIGYELAQFHQKGKYYQGDTGDFNRIGTWKELWEKRLDTLEAHWLKILNSKPTEQFDRVFIETFPYYLGLSENAIQYLVDCELDDEPNLFDAGTICSERFTSKSWGDKFYYKVPSEWIIDHPSRDLAEWIRSTYFQMENSEQEILKFLNEYEMVTPLTSFAWRLLYSRLLFPVHYFTTVENYYMSSDKDVKFEYAEQLTNIIDSINNYEVFLGNFFKNIKLPVTKLKIPQLDWLI